MAWKENFANIKDWAKVNLEGVKNIFKGAFDIIKGIMKVLWNIVKGDPDEVWAGIKLIWNGIKNIIKGFVQSIISSIVMIGISLFRVLKGIIEFVLGSAKKIAGFVGGRFFGKQKSSVENVDDFILSGGRLIKTNPNDIITGSRGGGGFGNVTFSPTINIAAAVANTGQSL